MSLLRPIRETSALSLSLARQRVTSMGWGRLLVTWVLEAAIIFVVGQLIPGITVDSPLAALLAALVIALLNALVRPVLILLTLPLTVLTAGLLSLLINAIVLVLAAPLVPGLEIDSLASAIGAAIVITVLSTFLSVILASDQDESFYAELTRRLASTDRQPIEGGRGLVIIQIDGLAAPILANAIRVGLTPRMAKWVRSGDYRLIEWECSPPSQTSASQAAILHGTNDDIPAFRWFEKESGRLMVSNHPADAAEIERRISSGDGLLAANGMSANNLFSGDAKRTLFTMSKIREPSKVADIDAFSLYFVDPSAFVRTIVLTIGEAAKEWSQARRQRASDIQPRVHRGRSFAVLRSITNVLMRDLNLTFLVQAIGRGVPIMYVDFVDYDELAHHAGPERLESLTSLAGVDRALASIERAVANAPREYSIVALSDHGQTQGATFLQRYGLTLDQLVRQLMGGGAASLSISEKGEGWGPVNALLTEIANRPGVAGRATASALGGRRDDHAVQLGSSSKAVTEKGKDAPEVVVGASGNLANVYFLAEPRRMTLEEIEATYPGLVEGLTSHPGIGFVLGRSEQLGALAMGARGVHYLDTGRIDGEDPLAIFGDRTAEQLRRLDGFAHVGDLLVNSAYDPALEEVAAFEELVGSHGGFGGPQVRPFILAPADLPYDGEPVVGAPAVHKLLVRWADSLGVGPKSGATDAPLTEAATSARAPGIKVIAVLTGLTALLWVLIGVLLMVGGQLVGGDDFVIAGAVLVVLAIIGLFVALGLWRHQNWARLAAIAWYAIGVLQALAAVGSAGLDGLLTAGLIPVALSVLVFFYLTRPHVAAAFRAEGTPAYPLERDSL
jgi:uncharacterized membrane protein YvlD (DUF360 family)